jgi:succinate dehydrogenase / fumarate reductase, cytochrome b subunit
MQVSNPRHACTLTPAGRNLGCASNERLRILRYNGHAQISEDATLQAGRPISPHLQIYRWYLSMVMSILHRASGITLAAGLVLLTIWLMSLASGPHAFGVMRSLTDSWFGGLVLFGYTVVLAYHMSNGIRHLAWDAGYGFKPEVFRKTGLAVLASTAVLTILTWIIVLAIA